MTQQNKDHFGKQLQFGRFLMDKHGLVTEPIFILIENYLYVHTKTYAQMLTAALLKHRKQSKCLSKGKLIKFDPYNISQEKKEKTSKHTTTLVNLKNIMLIERSETQKII